MFSFGSLSAPTYLAKQSCMEMQGCVRDVFVVQLLGVGVGGGGYS